MAMQQMLLQKIKSLVPFDAKGYPEITPNYTFFSNYVYLLEAAAAGKGLALGWKGLIERHLQDGVLMPVVNEYVTFDRAIYAILTARGRNNPLAQQFTACLADDEG